jgi:alanine racemase
MEMESFRYLPVQPRRDAWVEVNLGAIEHNARQIRQAVPSEVALMAIVKADAYGHGAAMVLPTLAASGVSMAGVASVDEAMNLRRAGVHLPILVIGGIPDWAVQFAAQDEIRLTVFAEHHLEALRQAAARRIQQSGAVAGRTFFRVHVKVDTGMHRIGVPWKEIARFITDCRAIPGVDVEGLFTHFANSADGPARSQQMSYWEEVCTEVCSKAPPLPRYLHSANSVAALDVDFWPLASQQNDNLARLGLAFFGYGAAHLDLQPAMGLKARILHIQELSAGEGVSYGPNYHTSAGRTVTRIATVPLGYADGIPRLLSNKIEGFLGNQRVAQVGTITMDQMMFDVTDAPETAIGEAITLLGPNEDASDAIWLTDWAHLANTIEYELMCGLRVRLPKTYIR